MDAEVHQTMSDAAINLGQALLRSESRYGDKAALLVPERSGVFRTVTYREMADMVRRYAEVLDELHLSPGDRVAIQGENSVNWALADWACQTLGLVVVPIYPTLPADQAQYIVHDAGASVVLAGSEEQVAKTKGMPGVRVELLVGAGSIAERAEAAGERMTREAWEARIASVKPDDLATIIYTSGTTGNPKGAMLQHRAFTSLADSILTSLPINEHDTFLSFLPISHVYERFAGHFLPICVGATIGYAGSLRTLANDLLAVRPTIMLCVPRFLESFKAKVVEGAAKAPPLRRWLFEKALEQGTRRWRGESTMFVGLLDKIVGQKIRDRVGGRLRFFVSGGAAMPMHVAEFFGAFNLMVLQGYGLTETTAATSFNPPDDNKPHTVGIPIDGVEVKIAADGEILIRGSSRMVGYYHLPEETAAAIDADGWFHSGDIGEFEGRHLKITDRKKDILVLANGKNVAPARIEGLLKEGRSIGEAVAFGDGEEYIAALIVPEFDVIRAELKNQGIEPGTDEQMIEREDVRAMVKKDVEAANRRLADFEKVKRHTLLARAFSIDEGELTPSLKVKRRVVRDRYASEIASMMK